MSETAWFTLLLRAIGLLVLLELVPGAVGSLASLPPLFANNYGAAWIATSVATLLGYLVAIGAALYLFVDGRRVARFCVRDLTAHCAVCGYPLTKVTGSVCPECGVPFGNQSRPDATDTPEAPKDDQDPTP